MSARISHKPLLDGIKTIIEAAKKQIAHKVNKTMLLTYFEIGRMFVQGKLQGRDSAAYVL